MKSEPPENIETTAPQVSANAICSIPYHTLALESDDKVMTDTTTKIFPDGRKISVGIPSEGSEETGIFVKIYKPLDDGKESLLSFRISEEAGAVLCSMLYDVLIERP